MKTGVWKTSCVVWLLSWHKCRPLQGKSWQKQRKHEILCAFDLSTRSRQKQAVSATSYKLSDVISTSRAGRLNEKHTHTHSELTWEQTCGVKRHRHDNVAERLYVHSSEQSAPSLNHNVVVAPTLDFLPCKLSQLQLVLIRFLVLLLTPFQKTLANERAEQHQVLNNSVQIDVKRLQYVAIQQITATTHHLKQSANAVRAVDVPGPRHWSWQHGSRILSARDRIQTSYATWVPLTSHVSPQAGKKYKLVTRQIFLHHASAKNPSWWSW